MRSRASIRTGGGRPTAGTPLDQVFFHIADAGRNGDGDERRALARRERAVCRPKPSASAPTRVALSSNAAAATSGAIRRSSASSSNRFSVATEARLSVPIATGTPAA